jgi:hypothetical protein
MSRTIQNRLHRAEQQVLAAVVDAQCRDWTADRPDRVGFARRGPAADELDAARSWLARERDAIR